MHPKLARRAIWVFGSNLRGAHGAGAALVAAKEYGAQYGVGSGRTGNAYAIPTLDEQLRKLPLVDVAESVAVFIEYARDHEDDVFLITRVGCGLAGFSDEEIAPLFAAVPGNCSLAPTWRRNRAALAEERSDSGEPVAWMVEDATGALVSEAFSLFMLEVEASEAGLTVDDYKAQTLAGFDEHAPDAPHRWVALARAPSVLPPVALPSATPASKPVVPREAVFDEGVWERRQFEDTTIGHFTGVSPHESAAALAQRDPNFTHALVIRADAISVAAPEEQTEGGKT